jgi:hypothetical protein
MSISIVLGGKQQKLNNGAIFRQNQGSSVSSPSSPSTASEVSPENSATIKYVPVHEILDEASPEALYGNLSEDNLKIAVNEHQRLLNCRNYSSRMEPRHLRWSRGEMFTVKAKKPRLSNYYFRLYKVSIPKDSLR